MSQIAVRDRVPEHEVTVTELECTRCGHRWFPRHRDEPRLPKVCSACKSPYWNVERGQKRGPRPKPPTTPTP